MNPAPPKLLPNGQPDQSNAIIDPPEVTARLIADLARGLPGFARMMATRR